MNCLSCPLVNRCRRRGSRGASSRLPECLTQRMLGTKWLMMMMEGRKTQRSVVSPILLCEILEKSQCAATVLVCLMRTSSANDESSSSS